MRGLWIVLLVLCGLLPVPGARAQSKSERAMVLEVVREFENAYMKKQKRRMLMELMAPTKDPVKIQQRYEWLRGHGPGDAPNTAPVLFQSARGSFVPYRYNVVSAVRQSPAQWTVVVNEEGTSFDEDGRYRVMRRRHFKIVKVGKKWMVGDYYLQQNPTNYGFPVDDICDRMQPLGK
ncbi:MAG: hypothetical protein NZ557_02810 [Chthonomonadaceae bacterium]|nr:hypothetical protein [Chthonomonadaceae bacterium]